MWFAHNFHEFPLRHPRSACVCSPPQVQDNPGRVKLSLELLSILLGHPVQESGAEVLAEMIRHTAVKLDHRIRIGYGSLKYRLHIDYVSAT